MTIARLVAAPPQAHATESRDRSLEGATSGINMADHPQFAPPTAAQQQQLGLELGAWIGDGGFKSVFRGTRLADDLPVAIAIGNPAPMETEAEVLRRLASDPVHPHVISLLDELFDVPIRNILVLTHAGSQELFDFMMDGGPLADGQLRPIAAQLVSGLRHMHRVGVCHADVKLDNIMIDAEGTVKFIDYKMSIISQPQPPPQLPIFSYHAQGHRGSRSYTAPELLADEAYDPRLADVWSLGVVLFAMCSNFFPFDVATAADWRYDAVRAGQGQPNYSTVRALYAFYGRNPDDFIDADLIDLIDNMLMVSPQARASLEAVATYPWLAPVMEAAGMDAHTRVIPLDPALWRVRDEYVRARARWRRLRPHARLVQRMGRAFIEWYEEKDIRPGGSEWVAARANFYTTAAELDSMQYRSLSAPPIYRAIKMAPEAYLALAAEALGDKLPTAEERKPPPLGRQPAQCPLKP
jgi:hypothetical protein